MRYPADFVVFVRLIGPFLPLLSAFLRLRFPQMREAKYVPHQILAVTACAVAIRARTIQTQFSHQWIVKIILILDFYP
jgi:hypothetical protein